VNPIQTAQQIKHLLEQVAWPGGSGDLVLGGRGSVAVFAGMPTEEQIPPGFPWAMVGIDSGEFDPDDPDFITQRFQIIAAAEVGGDRLGENALIGGAAGDIGRSANRGVGEIAERIRDAVAKLTGADGAPVTLSGSGTGSPSVLGRGRHMALAELSLSATCTSAPYFAAPQMLRWDPASGKWKWDGSRCSSRFDFVRYRLVRKRGPDPSATPSDGTVVYTGTAAECTVAQNSGYVYTAFADYSSRGNATALEGSSSPEVGSYRVV